MPPIHPDCISDVLSTKVFTNSSDKAIVCDIYKKLFEHTSAEADELIFQNSAQDTTKGWREYEAELLAKSLPEFTRCEKLMLQFHPLGDLGVTCIATALEHL